MTVPDRSRQQRLIALRRANDIRSARAKLKLDLKAGNVTASDVLSHPTPETLGMKVYDLLLAQRSWGKVKVRKTLNRKEISPSKTIGGLSARQRELLVNGVIRA